MNTQANMFLSTVGDHAASPEFQRAVDQAQRLAMYGGSYAIHYVPEWGPNGAYFTPGYRVYRSDPGHGGREVGLLPLSPPLGTPVAIVNSDGSMRTLAPPSVPARSVVEQ